MKIVYYMNKCVCLRVCSQVRWCCGGFGRYPLSCNICCVVPDCHRTSNYRISYRSADRQMGTTWCPSCMCSWRYQGERTDNCRYAWPQHLCGTCHRIPHPHCEFERIIIEWGLLVVGGWGGGLLIWGFYSFWVIGLLIFHTKVIYSFHTSI